MRSFYKIVNFIFISIRVALVLSPFVLMVIALINNPKLDMFYVVAALVASLVLLVICFWKFLTCGSSIACSSAENSACTESSSAGFDWLTPGTYDHQVFHAGDSIN